MSCTRTQISSARAALVPISLEREQGFVINTLKREPGLITKSLVREQDLFPRSLERVQVARSGAANQHRSFNQKTTASQSGSCLPVFGGRRGVRDSGQSENQGVDEEKSKRADVSVFTSRETKSTKPSGEPRIK